MGTTWLRQKEVLWIRCQYFIEKPLFSITSCHRQGTDSSNFSVVSSDISIEASENLANNSPFFRIFQGSCVRQQFSIAPIIPSFLTRRTTPWPAEHPQTKTLTYLIVGVVYLEWSSLARRLTHVIPNTLNVLSSGQSTCFHWS